MRRKIRNTILFLVVLFIIGTWFLSKHVLPYAIIQPPRVSVNIKPSDLGLQSSDINFTTEDSIHIKGYWIKSDSITPKSIIVFTHGIGGCKEHFLELSKKLSKIGVESVLVDSRAHGKSGGNFCTYGFKEKRDISKVIDYIKKKNDSVPIGIWGNSMGGAIAIQTLEFDKRIDFGIIESTFTNLDAIVYDYQKSYTYDIGFKMICNKALKEAGKIADFNPSEVSPLSSVKNIEQPIIIAHGENDKNIKFEYGKLLFENLKSSQKTFIPVKNGGHFDLAQKGGQNYYLQIENFVLEHSKQ